MISVVSSLCLQKFYLFIYCDISIFITSKEKSQPFNTKPLSTQVKKAVSLKPKVNRFYSLAFSVTIQLTFSEQNITSPKPCDRPESTNDHTLVLNPFPLLFQLRLNFDMPPVNHTSKMFAASKIVD